MEIVVKRKYIDSSRVESHGIPIKYRNAVHSELVRHLAEHAAEQSPIGFPSPQS